MAKAIPIDRAGLIELMRRTAATLRKARVTREEFIRRTGIKRDTIRRHFGDYNALVEATGLPDRYGAQRIGGDVLLRAVRDAFAAEGPMIPLRRIARLSGRSEMTFRQRFGRWREIVAAFVAWADREEPDFPHLGVLRQHYRLPPRKPGSAPPERRLGELLRFRTLEYAPTTEGGVIYLFGVMAGDLGFLVDGISKEFPDAEAKRRVGKEWRRCRIEFELESRSFVAHGHDPDACDLIVCWEHNWPDCPVEVLELKNAVRKLSSLDRHPGANSSPRA